MKMFYSFRRVVWAVTTLSSLTLLGCGGCASPVPGTKQETKSKSGHAVTWELSPEAQATYSYLVYDQALRHEDETTLLHSLQELSRHNPPPNVYVESSIWLLSRKSPDALAVLRMGLKAYPADISLNLLYAEALQESGQMDEAMAHMRAYAELHPESTDAKLELALLMVKGGKHSEAENLLKSITGNKRTAMVEYYHARALIGMKREGEAVRHLQKAIKGMPDFVEAMAELAYIHEQRKEYREARTIYEAMLRHNDNSQEVLLRLIALSLRLQQPQRALEFVRRGPNTTAFKITAAAMLIEARQYTEAEPLLQSLLGAPDAPADLYFYLAAVAYEGRKNIPQALQWLEKVPQNNPAYVRSVLLRAQLYFDSQKPEEAQAALKAAREAMPDQKEIWTMEMRILAARKLMSEALNLANEALRRWPDDAELAFLRASLLEEKGDKAAAMKAMEAIITKHPDHFQALNYVGYTLAEQNRDIPRALVLLQRAVELSPRSDYILDSLAWAQYQAGMLKEAWKTIQEAVAVGTTPDPTIWEHYGDIAQALGHKEEARKGYFKALEFKPANSESLRERLSQL